MPRELNQRRRWLAAPGSLDGPVADVPAPGQIPPPARPPAPADATNEAKHSLIAALAYDKVTDDGNVTSALNSHAHIAVLTLFHMA